MITSMNYTFVSKNNNILEYTHTLLEPAFITKLKLSIPWARKVEALKVTFDGNTLIIEGIYLHLRKLLKSLKYHTINI